MGLLWWGMSVILHFYFYFYLHNKSQKERKDQSESGAVGAGALIVIEEMVSFVQTAKREGLCRKCTFVF